MPSESRVNVLAFGSYFSVGSRTAACVESLGLDRLGALSGRDVEPLDREELLLRDERVAFRARDRAARDREVALRDLRELLRRAHIGLPGVLVLQQLHEAPARVTRIGECVVDGVGRLLEGVLLDRLDRLALGEDVARRVVREGDVDRVEDGDDLERDEEDEARDEELSRDEAVPGHHVDRVDAGSRHEQDDEGRPLLVVGQHRRGPDREGVEQSEEDDLDDEADRAGEEGDPPGDPRGPEDRLDVRWCRSGSRRHGAPCRSILKRRAPGFPGALPYATDQPILLAMLRDAVTKAVRALTAPAPRVDLTHAPPRSLQTEFIWGMFGSGTPPAPALPNAARTGSLTSLAALRFAGRPAARERQRGLRGRLCHVVRDQVDRGGAHAVLLRVLRHEQALDTQERHRLAGDLRHLDDLELDPARLERGRVPGARDPERGVLAEERALRGAGGDLRVDQAFLVPLVDQRSVLEELRVGDADVRRIEVAGGVLAEDVAAQAREERVHVVWVTAGALLDGDPEIARRSSS